MGITGCMKWPNVILSVDRSLLISTSDFEEIYSGDDILK